MANEATPPVVAPLSAWDERIAGFATAVGKPANEIVEALKDLVGDPGPEALVLLSDR